MKNFSILLIVSLLIGGTCCAQTLSNQTTYLPYAEQNDLLGQSVVAPSSSATPVTCFMNALVSCKNAVANFLSNCHASKIVHVNDTILILDTTSMVEKVSRPLTYDKVATVAPHHSIPLNYLVDVSPLFKDSLAWYSSDPSVAYIERDKVLTIDTGESVIFATDGKSIVQCLLRVSNTCSPARLISGRMQRTPNSLVWCNTYFVHDTLLVKHLVVGKEKPISRRLSKNEPSAKADDSLNRESKKKSDRRDNHAMIYDDVVNENDNIDDDLILVEEDAEDEMSNEEDDLLLVEDDGLIDPLTGEDLSSSSKAESLKVVKTTTSPKSRPSNSQNVRKRTPMDEYYLNQEIPLDVQSSKSKESHNSSRRSKGNNQGESAETMEVLKTVLPNLPVEEMFSASGKK